MKLSFITLILTLSLNHAIANASRLTFVKNNGNIYVETDEKHYAMFGQVMDTNGEVLIVAIDGQNYYSLKCDSCETDSKVLEKGKPDYVKDYGIIRADYLKIDTECPAISNIPTKEYSWSTTFIPNEKKAYSVTRLDDSTLVYSAKSFPNRLARLIISGDVVIFVHYDGHIALKTIKCLNSNERTLLNGIGKIKSGGKIAAIFSPSEEKTLKKYWKKHPINEQEFNFEQEYIEE